MSVEMCTFLGVIPHCSLFIYQYSTHLIDTAKQATKTCEHIHITTHSTEISQTSENYVQFKAKCHSSFRNINTKTKLQPVFFLEVLNRRINVDWVEIHLKILVLCVKQWWLFLLIPSEWVEWIIVCYFSLRVFFVNDHSHVDRYQVNLPYNLHRTTKLVLLSIDLRVEILTLVEMNVVTHTSICNDQRLWVTICLYLRLISAFVWHMLHIKYHHNTI